MLHKCETRRKEWLIEITQKVTTKKCYCEGYFRDRTDRQKMKTNKRIRVYPRLTMPYTAGFISH